MSQYWFTCKSCFAASAPARVWNVTNPTGYKMVISNAVIKIVREKTKRKNWLKKTVNEIRGNLSWFVVVVFNVSSSERKIIVLGVYLFGKYKYEFFSEKSWNINIELHSSHVRWCFLAKVFGKIYLFRYQVSVNKISVTSNVSILCRNVMFWWRSSQYCIDETNEINKNCDVFEAHFRSKIDAWVWVIK